MVFGFGGVIQFLDFPCFLLIHLSVDSAFRGTPSTFCVPTFALGLTDFSRCVPRLVVAGACSSKKWQRVEL